RRAPQRQPRAQRLRRAQGSGSTARNASHCVFGLSPVPTITVPSAETRFAVKGTHPCTELTPASVRSDWMSCIPFFTVQRKAWLEQMELVVSEVPTAMLPLSETL